MTDDNHCQSLVAQKEKAMREQKLPAAHFGRKVCMCDVAHLSILDVYSLRLTWKHAKPNLYVKLLVENFAIT